jgi:hypothetical protein
MEFRDLGIPLDNLQLYKAFSTIANHLNHEKLIITFPYAK